MFKIRVIVAIPDYRFNPENVYPVLKMTAGSGGAPHEYFLVCDDDDRPIYIRDTDCVFANAEEMISLERKAERAKLAQVEAVLTQANRLGLVNA